MLVVGFVEIVLVVVSEVFGIVVDVVVFNIVINQFEVEQMLFFDGYMLLMMQLICGGDSQIWVEIYFCMCGGEFC